MEIFFQTDYVTISWDEEQKAVFSVWQGYTGGGQNKVQTGYTKIAELMALKKSNKWLSDIRTMRVVDPADQQWILETGHSIMVKAGMRYIAALMPQNALGSMSVNSVINKVAGIDLEIKTFSQLDEAKKWLNTK